MIVLVLVLLAVGFSGCGGSSLTKIEVQTLPFETITFQNGDVTLAGTLDLPAGKGPFPAIVTVHGSSPLTPHNIFNLYISHYFVQQGYAVLRYDKRGTGDPNSLSHNSIWAISEDAEGYCGSARTAADSTDLIAKQRLSQLAILREFAPRP